MRRSSGSAVSECGECGLRWLRTGDPAGALEAITEAGQASPGPAGMINPVPVQRGRLLLAQGDLPAAARFAQDNGWVDKAACRVNAQLTADRVR